MHHTILDQDGALYPSLTQSIENLGELLYVCSSRFERAQAHTPDPCSVVLQTFIVGAELAIVKSSHPGILATSWVLLVRFIVMPAIALLFVWTTAGRGLYVDDKLVWCVHCLASVDLVGGFTQRAY